LPVFVTGAGIGRFFGEIMKLIENGQAQRFADVGSGVIVPGRYAFAGAAALGSGITHTLSTAVIMFEVAGQIDSLLGVLTSVLVAVAVSKAFSPSIYDKILKYRGLPYLPDLNQENYTVLAKDIMNRNVIFITKDFTRQDIIKVLSESDYKTYPIVDSVDSMILIGCVSREDLEYAQQAWMEQSRDQQKKLISKEKQGTDIEEEKDNNHRGTNFESEIDSDVQPFELESEGVQIPMQPAPIQLAEQTPLTKIHLLFITLRLSNCFVTNNGRLVGNVSRQDLNRVIMKKNEKIQSFHCIKTCLNCSFYQQMEEI